MKITSCLLIGIFFLVSTQFISQTSSKTVYDVLNETLSLREFFELIKTEVDILNTTSSPIAVFAPVDSSFNPENVSTPLLYTIAENSTLDDGELLVTYYKNNASLTAFQRLKVVKDADGNTYVNGKHIISGNLTADNGVVYEVDGLVDLPADTSVVVSQTFKTLSALVIHGNLSSAVDGADITILAPEDNAFAKLGSNFYAYLTADVTQYHDTPDPMNDLHNILLTHVFHETVYTANIPLGNSSLTAANGARIDIVKNPTSIDIIDPQGNEYSVNTTDILVANGVVQGINGVLLPSDFNFDVTKVIIGLQLSKFYDALNNSGVLEQILATSPYTIFAPNDAAFANFTLTGQALTNTLLYHIINGVTLSTDLKEGELLDSIYRPSTLSGPQRLKVTGTGATVTINGAVVTIANQIGSNGVIHVIDRVITLPEDISAVATSAKYDTLLLAATQAGIAPTLSGGNLTVFAPSDAAFNALPLGYWGYLYSNNSASPAKLAEILKFHILPQTIYSDAITANTTVPTLASVNLHVYVTEDAGAKRIFLDNNVNVTSADNLASNGVVHGIDGVLIPSTFTIALLDIIYGLKANSFYNLLLQSHVADLITSNNFTILVPVEDAFKEINTTLWSADELNSTLQNHILPGIYTGFVRNVNISYPCLNTNNEIVAINDAGTVVAIRLKGQTDSGDQTTISGQSYGLPTGRIFVVDKLLRSTTKSNKLSLGVIIAIAVVGGIIVLMIIGFIIYKVRSKADYEEV